MYFFPFLQRFAEIVRGLQGQLFADIRLCAGDSALLLTEHHTRLIEHLFLENQQAYFLFGGGQLRKSVSISSISASCKTSYSLTLVTTFCCISSPTILSRAFVLSKLCLSEGSAVYALTCSFSCPNISKNSSSSFFRNVFSLPKKRFIYQATT